jgi:hypothetical protein
MYQRTRKLCSEMQEDWGMHQSKLKKCKETLRGKPLRLIKGVEPDAMKVASPVLNGEVAETDRKAPRRDLTQQPDAVKVACPVLNAGDEETYPQGNAPCPYATPGIPRT